MRCVRGPFSLFAPLAVGAFGNADEELVRRSGTEIVGVSALSVVDLWKLVRLELGLESAKATAENLV